MLRHDTRPDQRLLVRVLRNPDELSHLAPAEFARAMDAAEDARLLGWLLTEAEARHAPKDPPGWLTDRMVSAQALVAEYDRAVHWEIDRLRRAFLDTGVQWVLLKGAAYLASGVAPGRGRRVADIDVLVPYAALSATEKILQANGWRFGTLDPYDERYYREWMHEIPPMIHTERESIVDVHHAILPRTGRLQPSSVRLVDQSIELEPGVRVLSPAHMVLHAAAHLFHDGEIAGAIRDLADLDGLLRAFGKKDTFWAEFLREGVELDLKRPAYYSVRYARRMFDTPVPGHVLDTMRSWAPPAPVSALMDALVTRAIPGPSSHASSAAAFALYVRSHWLKMPPLMLARHLLRKSLRRRSEA